jgi:hypothetical protein
VATSPIPPGALAVVDDEGARLLLDDAETALLLDLTENLEPATVSACPDCRSRVVAVVAFVDLLERALAHPRAVELIELAEDAPTLHLYLGDLTSACVHRRWRDPLYDEWADAFAELPPVRRLAP